MAYVVALVVLKFSIYVELNFLCEAAILVYTCVGLYSYMMTDEMMHELSSWTKHTWWSSSHCTLTYLNYHIMHMENICSAC